jgi:hypothetical protein
MYLDSILIADLRHLRVPPYLRVPTSRHRRAAESTRGAAIQSSVCSGVGDKIGGVEGFGYNVTYRPTSPSFTANLFHLGNHAWPDSGSLNSAYIGYGPRQDTHFIERSSASPGFAETRQSGS